MNSQLITETRDAFKINVANERVPNPIPVVEVGSKMVKNGFVRYADLSTTGNITITSAGFTNDWYLTGMYIGLVKDSNCDTTSVAVSGFISDVSTSSSTIIVKLPVITTTAQQITVFVPFEHPIKMSKLQAITMTGTFGAGIMYRTISVMGYFDELSNA